MTQEQLQNGITKLLQAEMKSETIGVVATRTPPKITTDKVNELGIKRESDGVNRIMRTQSPIVFTTCLSPHRG